MTESIPTMWNDERDAAFFGIAQTLTADGITDTAASLASQVSANDAIEKILQDLIAAESWEAMAMRCASRTTAEQRDLVPVPVVARRPGRS
jgi:hypothetical protein